MIHAIGSAALLKKTSMLSYIDSILRDLNVHLIPSQSGLSHDETTVFFSSMFVHYIELCLINSYPSGLRSFLFTALDPDTEWSQEDILTVVRR